MQGHSHRHLTHPLCSHPERQVERLASKYKRIDATHPMLQEILKKPEKFSSIWDVINRQLSLIKSRSQAFEDGEITVYDKALLVLSDNGNNVKNHGALNLYLEEFMGIAQDSESQKMNDAFNWHVALKGFLVKGMQRLDSIANCANSHAQSFPIQRRNSVLWRKRRKDLARF